MEFAEIRTHFGMHHGLFLSIGFDKLWAQSRSQENDKQNSGLARKTNLTLVPKLSRCLARRMWDRRVFLVSRPQR